ncbi:hypothetical protein LY56_00865 [Roseinatronobacter thiooxidans]|uniref:Uncharacterized protein n=1 Tax=Roseinatronobacter thiooxidans TaxID=121821 RepID=A0A2W7QEQ1_9RHOB|nr:hypothetical protein [Roseinatronobacter thiooxidans]PZX46661.1 hypothetical protein LY56_00865 [Roseinatronobacter thiooxidans]
MMVPHLSLGVMLALCSCLTLVAMVLGLFARARLPHCGRLCLHGPDNDALCRYTGHQQRVALA